MSGRGTDGLLDELVGRLEPVRPRPAPIVGVAAVLVVWAALFGALFALGGVPPDVVSSLGSSVGFSGVLLGLALAAHGGAIGGMAGCMPGHDTAERLGAAAAAIGVGLAVAAAGLSTLQAGGASGVPLAADFVCLAKAVGLALLPAAVLLGFVLRGWVPDPMRVAGLALIGACSVGAATLHVFCPYVDARHFLLGHVGAPIGVLALGLVPLAWLLRRVAR